MVRWITRWDREAVTDMLRELARQHGVEPSDDALNESFDFALRFPDQVRFCVAVRDGKVLGMASIHRAFSTWRGQPKGTIEDVFVAPDARRAGVATALLAFLVAEARRRAYCALSLDVMADNEGARSLYARCGITDSGYVVCQMDLRADEG